eukprot:755138-Hanusia_phi.AAC.3
MVEGTIRYGTKGGDERMTGTGRMTKSEKTRVEILEETRRSGYWIAFHASLFEWFNTRII